jgi:hypothetical protein
MAREERDDLPVKMTVKRGRAIGKIDDVIPTGQRWVLTLFKRGDAPRVRVPKSIARLCEADLASA